MRIVPHDLAVLAGARLGLVGLGRDRLRPDRRGRSPMRLIAGLGSVAAWPLAARAQQPETAINPDKPVKA
jgi:hypothetical protein